MRNVLAAAILLTLCSALPAAAAPCPGTVVFHDPFTSPNPALDVGAYPQSKVSVQGGKAEITFLQGGSGRDEEYAGQYGDVNLCASFTTLKTDKPENQSVGIIFWGVNYANFYSLQIQPGTGMMSMCQMVPGTGWTAPIPWTANAAVIKTMGAVNTLQVQTKGNVATFFINGQNVGTYTGTPPAGGGTVGFTVSTSNASSDTLDVTDFSVAIPSTPAPAS